MMPLGLSPFTPGRAVQRGVQELYRRILSQFQPGQGGSQALDTVQPAAVEATTSQRSSSTSESEGGFHPSEQSRSREFEQAMRFLEESPSVDAFQRSQELELLERARRGRGMENTAEQRRLLATALGPGESWKVENAVRTQAREDLRQKNNPGVLASRLERQAHSNLRRARDPEVEEARRRRMVESARRMLLRAESLRSLAGLPPAEEL